MIKNRKFLLKIVLIVICIILIIYIGIIAYRFYVLRKIYNNRNIEVMLGNNYRIITLRNGEVYSKIYYKDGVTKIISSNETTTWTNESGVNYIINHIEQTYRTREESAIEEKWVVTFNFKFHPILDSRTNLVAIFEQIFSWSIRTGELDNKEHYIVRIPSGDIWIDRETFLIRKNEINGGIIVFEHIVEKNIVTERDISKPSLENYTLVY